MDVLNQPNLKFPIRIPLKFRYIYSPSKLQPAMPVTQFINFKPMTGNEILLNLEKADALKTSELCGGLIELSSRQSPRGNSLINR